MKVKISAVNESFLNLHSDHLMAGKIWVEIVFFGGDNLLTANTFYQRF